MPGLRDSLFFGQILMSAGRLHVGVWGGFRVGVLGFRARVSVVGFSCFRWFRVRYLGFTASRFRT